MSVSGGNMRYMLTDMLGKRGRYKGKFVRTGIRPVPGGYIGTILLIDVKDTDNRLVASHIWFDALRCFRQINLMYGDIVAFSARVEPYSKNNYEDFRFSCPKNVHLTIE